VACLCLIIEYPLEFWEGATSPKIVEGSQKTTTIEGKGENMQKRIQTVPKVIEANYRLSGEEFDVLQSLVSKIINKNYTSITSFEELLLIEMIEFTAIEKVATPKETEEKATIERHFISEISEFDGELVRNARSKVCKVKGQQHTRGLKPCMTCEFEKCPFYCISRADYVAAHNIAIKVMA